MTSISPCMCLVAAHRLTVTLLLTTSGDLTWTVRSGSDPWLQVSICTYRLYTVYYYYADLFFFSLLQDRTRLPKPVPRLSCLRICWFCLEAGHAPVRTLCTSLSVSSMRSTHTHPPKTGECGDAFHGNFTPVISNARSCSFYSHAVWTI